MGLSSDIPMANKDWVERVTDVMKRSLRALDMITLTVQLDSQFYQQCYEAAVTKGHTAEGWMCITPYLENGVAMAQCAFPHIQRAETRIWIALWTAFLSVLDDSYDQVPRDVIASFAVRMVSGQPQPHAGLEHFAAHLREVSQHVDGLRAGFVIVSTFNLVSSLQVESSMAEREIPPAAARFPSWCSILSGVCDGFAMFVFPREVPFEVIAPAIPDILITIRNWNDVFSFFKEEQAEDASTHICLLAKVRGEPKLDVLDSVANETIIAHQNICTVLRAHPEAYAAWMTFARGYAEFHYVSGRYRLEELKLD